MGQSRDLDAADLSAIIQMALSDHVPFATIELDYGLSEKEVQAIMRRELKPGSYRAWRKRVHDFGTRRAQYK
ncbi:TIGR03643 family protein [Sulfitobacter sp. S223]|uniref:TIGR03643 family protein n=1 Tax=Sulfitobacter sp. S223 TaxID=2867023 RepID=UPI0021A61674|nr:TIGR03643 family protein [Sulfitobacter sp. S223]UWR27239.1 TIGR03643 family protein [Sulfitobacter sp. S223]